MSDQWDSLTFVIELTHDIWMTFVFVALSESLMDDEEEVVVESIKFLNFALTEEFVGDDLIDFNFVVYL